MGRLLGLGAQALGEVRGGGGTLWWAIMADPEGNEFRAFGRARKPGADRWYSGEESIAKRSHYEPCPHSRLPCR
jgi:hypothetical protein